MSTVMKDKDGKVLKTLTGTQYHPDGTGPRDSKGKPIVDNPAPAAPDGAGDKATKKETGS
jgi:hypothetical protein